MSKYFIKRIKVSSEGYRYSRKFLESFRLENEMMLKVTFLKAFLNVITFPLNDFLPQSPSFLYLFTYVSFDLQSTLNLNEYKIEIDFASTRLIFWLRIDFVYILIINNIEYSPYEISWHYRTIIWIYLNKYLVYFRWFTWYYTFEMK